MPAHCKLIVEHADAISATIAIRVPGETREAMDLIYRVFRISGEWVVSCRRRGSGATVMFAEDYWPTVRRAALREINKADAAERTPQPRKEP